MITEAVIRVILHCSRCNTPFKDDEYGSDHPILWLPDELAKAFPPDMAAAVADAPAVALGPTNDGTTEATTS